MMVSDEKVVGIRYTLRNDAGEMLDESGEGEPMQYLHGVGQIVPGLEQALKGQSPGAKIEISVSAEDGYGERDDAKQLTVGRDQVPDADALEIGAAVVAEGPDGETVIFWVKAVEESTVQLDGNHPLAGQTLNFDVEVVSVRDATAEELAHGHVHGPGGHHH